MSIQMKRIKTNDKMYGLTKCPKNLHKYKYTSAVEVLILCTTTNQGFKTFVLGFKITTETNNRDKQWLICFFR